MSKNNFKWLGLAVLSFATLLVMGGCGGGGSTPAATPVAKVSGTVTFPTTASVSLTSLGKRVTKSVALGVPTTIELRDLNGKLIDSMSATVTETPAGSGLFVYSYSFPNVPIADYVVKAVRGDVVMRALVEMNTLTADETKTKNVDAVSTTAVIVTEQKLGATPGTIGEPVTTANAANALKFTPTLISAYSAETFYNDIMKAVGTITASTGVPPTATEIALMNLINIVAASVVNNVNPAAIITNTVAAPSAMTTKQYTAANVATGGTATTIVVEQAAIADAFVKTDFVYVAPPVDSVAFTSKVMDNTSSTTTVAPPFAGVEVTTIGLPTVIKTFTDPNGYYTLVGIPKNTPFVIKMSKSGNTDSYSAQFSLTANSDTSNRPYNIWNSTKLTSWGNTVGTGVIRSSVVESTNLVSGFIAGVVVTATDSLDATVTYPVVYLDPTTNSWGSSSTGTYTNGNWMVKNVPAGKTVNVTASKTGYTFNTRTFVTVANAVCMGRLTGTAVPVVVVPPTANALKASLQAGWYDFRSRNIYSLGTNTNYYSVERIGLASDGVTMTQTTPSYFDRVSKTWVTTMPTGFPTNSTDYALSPSGVWVTRNSDGPQGMTAVFNADGTARLTDPISGEIVDVSVTTVDLAGQAISADALDGAPLLATASVYPSGSVAYSLNVTSLNDGYQLWNSYSNLTTLAEVPAAFAENINGGGNNINIDNNSSTEYYYGKFVSPTSSSVNIYRNTQNSTTPATLIGQATAATSTVLGQQIMEITIPSALKTTYALTQNPIFAVNQGIVMMGTHSPIGTDANKGGYLYNDTANNHIKANINTALAKPVLAKSISKAILGR